MRLVSRLILYLILCILLVSLSSSYYQIDTERRGLNQDLQKRAAVLSESLQPGAEHLLAAGAALELNRLVQRFGNSGHLAGIAVYDQSGKLLAATAGIQDQLSRFSRTVMHAMIVDQPETGFVRTPGTPGPLGIRVPWWNDHRLYAYALPLHSTAAQQADSLVSEMQAAHVIGALITIHNADYIRRQTLAAWREVSVRVLIQIVFIAVITLLIFQRSVAKPMARTVQWMRELRNGRAAMEPVVPEADVFKPLAHEVTTFARSLAAARASAQQEARMRDAAESSWTAERLSVALRDKLKASRLFVVSNREPYSHVRQGKSIEAVMPASGLVTALEPILRACDGTWVAHGSGEADREVVDQRNCLRVPPDSPRYTLRRVWLTKEEEEGYYFGFSNEGLWPLCHIAHTRPIFRAADWNQYRAANEKFADALLHEMEGVNEPIVIVQDYHFALLPRIIKQQRPDARVGLFWHIPWPNPEAFGICPWQRELLDGMLGADLLGFHIQSHCDNFLETVDRVLESRIEWERFAVNRREHVTLVRPFPISVVFPDSTTESKATSSRTALLGELVDKLGVQALYLGVGVDRVDYTKGIVERFLGIERFLEKYPQWQGKFTFAQIGAPSRTHIKRYHDFLGEVEAEAERINWRFQNAKWKPIVFLNRHHSHAECERFYRAADLCLVTSLHDGMNLVAKEFIAAREDEQGALILSPFTGAARELPDALLVNPYDTEELADAINFALEMDTKEQRARMRRMRQQVRQQNVYRWAANLITDLCEIRIVPLDKPAAKTQKAAS